MSQLYYQVKRMVVLIQQRKCRKTLETVVSLLECFPHGQYWYVNCVMGVQNCKLRYLFSIAMAILEVLISQTKVGNFANKVVIKKNISSCQVSMDYLQKDIILHCEYDNAFFSF